MAVQVPISQEYQEIDERYQTDGEVSFTLVILVFSILTTATMLEMLVRAISSTAPVSQPISLFTAGDWTLIITICFGVLFDFSTRLSTEPFFLVYLTVQLQEGLKY